MRKVRTRSGAAESSRDTPRLFHERFINEADPGVFVMEMEYERWERLDKVVCCLSCRSDFR